MTALASYRRVLAIEVPAVFDLGIVVVKADLAGWVVARLAAQSQAALVCVVLEVATAVAALHLSGLVATSRVAAFAACLFVFANQRIVALIVIEFGCRPARTFVAVVAGVFAERAFVQSVFVTRSAHRWRVSVLIVFVAGAAVFDAHPIDDVAIDQLERLARTVANLDSLVDGFGIDALFDLAGLLVALQALV